MLLLGDGLASGAALKQYETLLRRLPEDSIVAKLANNVNKNRYRDIAPCELVSDLRLPLDAEGIDGNQIS